MSYSPLFRGRISTAPTTSVESTFMNGSGVTLDALMPVCSNTSGDIVKVDVSDESKALSVIGFTAEEILAGDSGRVIVSGRIIDVVLALAFGPLYISKTGVLTDVKPSVGVGGFDTGDFMVRIGVLVKNESNPLKKDIVLNIVPVGQL
jgi:hypothetical protein